MPSGEGLTPDEATLPTRLALLTAALWWGVFSVPLFLRVREPAPTGESTPGQGGLLGATVGQVRTTWRHLREYPQAARMLLAFLVYNDGIQSIFRLAVIFGTLLHFEPGVLMAAILVVQLVGIPFAVLFGRLAARIGTRPAVLIGVGAYLFLTLFAFWVQTPTHFILLATGVGLVQGGTQALSRSLFSSLVPRERSAEFFALFAVLEKFAGIVGPTLFGLVIGITASPRLGILTVLPMFVIGGLLLLRVDVERGRREVIERDGRSVAADPSAP
jgi:MFS transporter, UMF1 family